MQARPTTVLSSPSRILKPMAFTIFIIRCPLFDFLNCSLGGAYFLFFLLSLAYLMVPVKLTTREERNVRVNFVLKQEVISTKCLPVIF